MRWSITALLLVAAGPAAPLWSQAEPGPAPLRRLGAWLNPNPAPDRTPKFGQVAGQEASAVAIAAGIQADQAAADTRWAAVRFLGTVDSRSYPEAETALIDALRTDRVESVRLEAARALARFGSASPAVLAALHQAASGGTGDGHPAENSAKVQAEALASLNLLLNRQPNGLPQPPRLLPPETRAVREEALKQVAGRIGAPAPGAAEPSRLPPPPVVLPAAAPMPVPRQPAWLQHGLRPIGTLPESR